MPTDAAGRAFLAQKANEPGVISRPSGLLYKYTEKGSGNGHPMPSTPCDFHYKGTLINGEEFDSSYKRGKPSEFTADGVVPGCTEGYQLMVEGDKVIFYIPSELAYGDAGIEGLIPSGAVLVFEVHLVKIKGQTKPKANGQLPSQMPQQARNTQLSSASSAQPQYAQARVISEPQVSAQPQYAQARVISEGQNYTQPQYSQAQAFAQPQPQYSQAQAFAQPQPQYSQCQVIAERQAYAQQQMSMQQPAFAQQQVYGGQSQVYGQPQAYAQSAPLTSGGFAQQQAFMQPSFGQPQVFQQGGFRR